MGVAVYLDTILVPLSLFITIGYHAYLCHNIKNKPSRTTYGINKLRRTTWGVNLNQVIGCEQLHMFIHEFSDINKYSNWSPEYIKNIKLVLQKFLCINLILHNIKQSNVKINIE